MTRPANRPLIGDELRVIRSYRLNPATAKWIEDKARASGTSQGLALDWLVEHVTNSVHAKKTCEK